MGPAPGLRTCLRRTNRPAAGPRDSGHVLLLPSLPQGHIFPTPPAPTTETAVCCQGPGVAQGAVGGSGNMG